MSDEDQARLNQVKKSLLAAGKQAQKEKDAAKVDYEKQKEYGMVSDDEPLAQWCLTNRPSLQVSYQEYQGYQAQYTHALQRCDESARKEWQQAENEGLRKLFRAEDAFERNYYINLPEE